MNVLDLFSGIGGFSLGLERAGMRTVAFCEIDPFCRRVLAKRWPSVPCYDDVRTLTAKRLHSDGIAADVICGGFPCQDISVAGKGEGIDGARSGLWSEYARIIGELRPRYVIVENVSALLGRGLGRVLGDLATIGYDAEWHCICGYDVGIPQRRERLWIAAYPTRSTSKKILDQDAVNVERLAARMARPSRADADAYHEDSGSGALSILANQRWPAIPHRERVGSNGRLSDGVDRYRGIGNSVIPQIPELIGRAIMSAAA